MFPVPVKAASNHDTLQPYDRIVSANNVNRVNPQPRGQRANQFLCAFLGVARRRGQSAVRASQRRVDSRPSQRLRGVAQVPQGHRFLRRERGQGASRDDPEDRGFKREGSRNAAWSVYTQTRGYFLVRKAFRETKRLFHDNRAPPHARGDDQAPHAAARVIPSSLW